MTKLYAVSSALLTGLVSTIICIPINIALFDGSSTLFSTANGLDSDSVRAICEGNDGSIYVGTALSMSKISAEGSVKTYYKWKEVIRVQSLVSLENGGIAGVTNGGTLFS